jgi:hypothetical protein
MTEVMSCFDFNQEQPNQSLDTCGFAATALCFAAGPPGSDPRHTVQWAIQQMAAWYTEFDGPNIRSNTNGMETWQLYKLIVEKGGHYQAIDANATSIASWIKARYPVIVAVTEDSVYDVHLKAKPYTWDTSGLSHIFTVTGIDHDHIFLMRDTLNQHDGSPYSYDGDRLSYLSATVFVPDWMPRPASAIAPQGGTSMSTPDTLKQHGWHDDGTTLVAPNSVPIVRGFRGYILAHNWNPDNWPLAPEYGTPQLEGSNQALGGGTQQVFRWTMLGWTEAHGVFEEWTGQELLYLSKKVADYYKQIQDLQKQLQGGQPVPPTDPLASQALVDIRQVKAISGKY